MTSILVPELDCGHEAIKRNIGTGVAYNSDGESMCYDCAYKDTMDDVVMTGVLDNDMRLPVLYMSVDGTSVTTWDGQFVGKVTYHGAVHPWATRYKDTRQSRHTIDVKIVYGADVVNAYGIGAPGEYCVLRRRKSDVRKAA